ncbi:MAG: hypothetical protein RSJ40_10540, partial [Acetivibrio sp.]
MLPKNVRQIGFIEGNKRIYIEDYVMTFAGKTEGMSVLLGRQEKEGEETVLYISGAVTVKNRTDEYPETLKNEDWSGIYEDVKKHFDTCEIMGWLLVRKDVIIEIDHEIRKIHEENFKGNNKILFLFDKGEGEEAFYLSNAMGELKKQTGFYIYYEKNEAMQNYMIEKNPDEKVEEKFKDEAMDRVREIIAQKEPPKNEKKVMNLMYGASTLLAAVVLVIGATMLDNYDKMKNMEATLNVISDNLEETKEMEKESKHRVEVEEIAGNTQKVDRKEVAGEEQNKEENREENKEEIKEEIKEEKEEEKIKEESQKEKENKENKENK